MNAGPKSLVSCERGAMLIMSLFATSLLVAMIFYVLGVGHAIHHGDRLHDAADSAAYAQAVMSARGMNLMSLLNMVKLSVVAVSTALVASALAASETIAWILSDHFRRIAFGWTIPFLSAVQLQATTKYLDQQKTFSEVTEAADHAQQALRTDLPLFAQWRASTLASSYDTVTGAFAAPLRFLPTKAEPQLNFCTRVFPYAHQITHKAFSSVPVSIVRDHARGTADALTVPLCMVSGVGSVRLNPDAHMGEEPFAHRLYSVGETIRNNEESGIRMATWRRNESAGGVGVLREKLSQVGLAQSEFYFAGASGEADMLWEMQWKARMRRFRAEAGFTEFAKACAIYGAGLNCPTLTTSLETGRELIVH